MSIKKHTQLIESVMEGLGRGSLSKTEFLLLSKAFGSKDNYVSGELISGQGSKGGRIYEGARPYNAIKSLIKKGYLEEVNSSNSSHSWRGYTTKTYGILAKITDKGMEFMKSLESSEQK